MMAGIPVALILLGAELVDGVWRLDRNGDGLALSWTPIRDARMARFMDIEAPPTVRIMTCLSNSCERMSLIVSLPRHHFQGDMVSFARTMVGALTGDCPEDGKPSRPLAMV
jgi:hypothetical protein